MGESKRSAVAPPSLNESALPRPGETVSVGDTYTGTTPDIFDVKTVDSK